MSVKGRIQVTSFEIANYMLREKRELSAPEVAEAMRTLHPDRRADINEIYTCIKRFTTSHNAVCRVNTECRPRKFKLEFIDSYYFRGLSKRTERILGPGQSNIPQIGKLSEKQREKNLLEWAYLTRKLMDSIIKTRTT